MTDAQIALYAALRVAVPVEWRISGRSNEIEQVVYFERPVYAEEGSRAPGFARFFRLPNRQVVGIEKLGQMIGREELEKHPGSAIRRMVMQARDKLAAA